MNGYMHDRMDRMDRIRVDDGRATEADLAARPEAAGVARGLLHAFGGRVHDDVVERAKLLMTEVVSNSVLHGTARDPIHVSVEARPETLHVQVRDTGPSFEPEVHLPRDGSESGWGLFLVETLSDRWGIRPSEQDVTVWFELDL
jgi:anti-sigma regulatory factor (Ser/Thr protein kinase)